MCIPQDTSDIIIAQEHASPHGQAGLAPYFGVAVCWSLSGETPMGLNSVSARGKKGLQYHDSRAKRWWPCWRSTQNETNENNPDDLAR
jgi:hypothetical protein